ncbi:hypothetical protein EI94DRAFT_1815380 [Lactarius quietus]|nr:hypothetical protein EI94DRAFT_1815380 [Lactarius quietus]
MAAVSGPSTARRPSLFSTALTAATTAHGPALVSAGVTRIMDELCPEVPLPPTPPPSLANDSMAAVSRPSMARHPSPFSMAPTTAITARGPASGVSGSDLYHGQALPQCPHSAMLASEIICDDMYSTTRRLHLPPRSSATTLFDGEVFTLASKIICDYTIRR